MKLKRQMGGIVRNREFSYMGEIYLKRSKSLVPLGPIGAFGKNVAIAYFGKWPYRRWKLENGFNLSMSVFFLLFTYDQRA